MRKNVFVNIHAVAARRFDSGALGVLCTLGHPLGGDEGRYVGVVSRDDVDVGRFEFVADGEATELQTDLDLADFRHGGGRRGAPSSARVHPEGYFVAHVSRGGGGFAVRLEGPGPSGGRKQGTSSGASFDSRRLQDGDLFCVTLIRPGLYRASGNGNAAEVRVAYPEPGGEPRPRSMMEPARVACDEGTFEPTDIEVDAGQGLVFEADGATQRIVLELEEPDDGPEERDGPGRTDGARLRYRREKLDEMRQRGLKGFPRRKPSGE